MGERAPAAGDPERGAVKAQFFERIEATALDGCPEGENAVLVQRSAAAGCMAPLHTRDEEESYRVLEGRVTFFIGEATVAAGEGDVVVAPAGVPRTFRGESGRARWLVLTRVHSLQRFEDFGRASCLPVADEPPGEWMASEDATVIAALGRANGIDLLGPPGALPRRAP